MGKNSKLFFILFFIFILLLSSVSTAFTCPDILNPLCDLLGIGDKPIEPIKSDKLLGIRRDYFSTTELYLGYQKTSYSTSLVNLKDNMGSFKNIDDLEKFDANGFEILGCRMYFNNSLVWNGKEIIFDAGKTAVTKQDITYSSNCTLKIVGDAVVFELPKQDFQIFAGVDNKDALIKQNITPTATKIDKYNYKVTFTSDKPFNVIDPVVTYLPNSTNTVKGYLEAVTGSTTLWTWSEIDATAYSSADLQTVSLDDDASYVEASVVFDPSQSGKIGHRFIFNITQDPATITNITVLIKHLWNYAGQYFSGNNLGLYIGNVTNHNWIKLAEEGGPSTNTIYTHSGSVNGNISNYINQSSSGNYIYIQDYVTSTDVMSSGGNVWLWVYYVELNVTVTEEAPTDTCSCPVSGNWIITNGDICSLTTICSIIPNKIYINNGILNIRSEGFLDTGGCYVNQGSGLYIDALGRTYCGG